MVRVVIANPGGRSADAAELPPLDIADASFSIGSGPDARVRLPASAAQVEHVRIEGGRWRALGPVRVEGVASSAATNAGAAPDAGEIGDGVTLGIADYRVRIAPAPEGSVAAGPQRTESLARELMRSLLGSGAAP